MLSNLMSASGISLVRAIVQFSMNIVLVRFIDPSAYGVMAFVLPIWTFVTLMSEMGLNNAIVRASTLTPEESGAALKVSLAAAVGGVGLMLLLALVAERFLADVRVAATVDAMAVVLFLAMSATVPRALLERELRYGLIARIEIAATLTAAPICIGAATLGAGVWSLIFYYLCIQITRVACFYAFGRDKISLAGKWCQAKPLVAFGGWVLAFNVQNFLARNTDNIIIGIYLGTTALGVYGLSYQIMTLPLLLITWPASSVLLATLGKYTNQSDENSANRYARALCQVTATVSFPIAAYLACGITFPVHSYMGPLWHDVPDVLFWLAPVGALQSIAAYSGAVLLASGKARVQLYVGLCSTFIYLCVFLVAARFGLNVFVVSYAITSALIALVHFHLIVRYSLGTWRRLSSALLPGVLIAGAATGGYELTSLLATPSNFFNWLAATILFAIGGALALWSVRRSLIDDVVFLATGRSVS